MNIEQSSANPIPPAVPIGAASAGAAADGPRAMRVEPPDERTWAGVGALARPKPIGEQSWPEGTVPLVSICCITYNHAPFIRQCLDGFLMQETTFPVEILIHDDASSDGTALIIREYTAKYPDLLKPILQTENQYSKGVKPNATFNFPRVRGEYIAICEGDDYWTEKTKLLRQVGILDKNPEFVGSFHNVRAIYEDCSRDPHPLVGSDAKAVIKLEDLLLNNGIPTLSVLYRAGLHNRLPGWYFRMPFGDWPLHILNAQRGSFVYIPLEMATYRVHGKGVWSGIGRVEQLQKTVIILDAVNRHLNYQYHGSIRRRIAHLHYQIASALSREKRGREVLGHLWKSLGSVGVSVPIAGVLWLVYKHALPWFYARTNWRLERLRQQWRQKRR